METNQAQMPVSTKGGAKNFFLNFGAIIALYTVVISLINLLFTIINTAYPQIINGYSYTGSQSISWPVATIIIFFPIFIILMWLLEKEYILEPEKKNTGIHKWLAFITLFVAGLTVAIDLITVLYYFIDGRELTAGFLLKVLVLLVIASCIFIYYISDITGKLTLKSRKIWRVVALLIVLGSVIWGFAVLGSPRTQRLNKYDEQKVNDLQNLNNQITNFYGTKGFLPQTEDELSTFNYSFFPTDPQSNQKYVYQKTGDLTYNLCATFNSASNDKEAKSRARIYPYGDNFWIHPVGEHCFGQTVNPSLYTKPVPIR